MKIYHHDDSCALTATKKHNRAILVLCVLGASTLTGCGEGAKDAHGDAKSFIEQFMEVGAQPRGCKTEDLYAKLQIDGKDGLDEQQVYGQGIQVCQVPSDSQLGKYCRKPLPMEYTEVRMMCPFMFNTWELPKDRLYGKGEADRTRHRLIARCVYSEDQSEKPKWCFTDWCQEKAVNCFTSRKAAEAAKPWEGPAEDLDKMAASAEQMELTKMANDTYQSSENEAVLAQMQDDSSPHKHHHKGARHSSVQVTQRAFVVDRV